MADAPQAPSDRLDSWKAIAEYLSRDVATVRRWEKTLGLPVRRMPGGRPGHSVYAYVSEIEGWLKANSPDQPSNGAASAVAPTPQTTRTADPRRPLRLWHAGAGAAVLLLAVAGAALTRSATDVSTLDVLVEPGAVVARDADGRERWRYAFRPDQRVVPTEARPEAPADVLAGGRSGILVGIGMQIERNHETISGGQLLWLTPEGRLDRSFSFDDRLVFGEGDYGTPWPIADFRIDGRAAARRVAVVAHHAVWWPGLVTVLDERGRRAGTFVNPGWIGQVRWLPGNRLLVAGFSNPRDGGMVALLDAGALDGQAPAAGDPKYRCSSCPDRGPIRYLVFPRSEVNRASGSPFNRAIVQVLDDRVLVRTIEAPTNGGERADVLYELSPSLDLIRASFSDRYWEVHHALEVEKRLDHGREQCPDRDGPRAIDVWDPQAGWRSVETTATGSHSGTSLASTRPAQK